MRATRSDPEADSVEELIFDHNGIKMTRTFEMHTVVDDASQGESMSQKS